MGRQALQGRALVALAAAAVSLTLVSAVSGADAPVVTATQAIAGLNDVVSGGYEPPDVSIAAGPSHLVELVNLAERAWRTDAGPAQPVQTRTLAQLFASGPDRLTDPRILYDAPSRRWLASVSDIDRNSVLLAVSASSDPTGSWTVSPFLADGCADQPRLGVADAVVVLAADVFADCDSLGSPAAGAELWAISKAELLAGSTSPSFRSFGPTRDYSSLTPVQSLSATADEYVVSVDDRVSRVVHLLAVRGTPPGPVTFDEVATPTIAPLARPPQAAQPASGGARPPLSTNDNRVLDAAWENGMLWLAANNRCTPGGEVIIRTCARVVALSTGTGAVTTDLDLGYPGVHVFYPALRPDRDGNVVVTAAESGVGVLPELIAVAVMHDGTVTQPIVVARSTGIYRGDRYGDYFGAARDPVDPSVVWVGGEAGTDIPSGRGWATTLASIVATPAGATPPAVAVAAPPGVRALGSVARTGATVRLAYRALDDGISVRTVVVVRRHGSVVFHTTTPRATLRSDQRYVVPWPARAARGTFTYCVNALSDAGVSSPQSCVTITVR